MVDRSSSVEPRIVHEAVLQAWDCAFADKRVVYLSGPITTGPRLVEAVRNGIPDRDAIVREANSADLVSTAQRLRAERGEIVVEPASLNIFGWSQHDYLRLWDAFIERHVRLVVFMPGWQFSAGCAMEFAQAIEHGVATETLDRKPLGVADALRMLKAACDEIDADLPDPTIARLKEAINTAVSRIVALSI